MTKRGLPALLLSFALFAGLAFTAWHNVAQVLAQSVTPTPRAHQNFVDQTGNPCVGCSLYVYLAGTTTPTPTYTDYTGGTPNTNPIILDVAGGAAIWLTPTITYKFVLCEGGTPPSLPCLTYGTVQWTSDQVPGLPGLNTFMPLSGGTFTGAVTGLASTWTSITAPIINSLQADEYHTTSMNGPLLSNFWRYLHSAPIYQGTYLSAGMDIIIANDSLWEGDQINSATTCAGNNTAVPQYSQNRQAEQIRIALQAQYGYGGTGLQPVINVGQCGSATGGTVNPELYTAAGPSTVATTSEIGPQDTTHGYYSVVVMSAGQTITWNGGGLPYTFARIYCADDSTSNSLAITIDGNSVGSACGTQNSTPIARVFTTTPLQSNTNHTLVATCTSGHCLLYGMEGRPSTGNGNAGIRVHNLSVGSVASGFFISHWDFENLISNGVSSPSAQLVIYAMGTNDASYGVGVPTYTSNFEAAFAHYAAETPEPPVIVIYRPGLDNVASQSYFTALTAYGYANNLLVIDQTNRWGTGCTTGCWWLGNDNVHMNDGGNLDSSHTILNALTDVIHGQPASPLAGDTGLNAGIYRVTSPALSGNIQVPGYVWDGVPGIPSLKGIYGWQTGNLNNLPGAIGLFDPLAKLFAWMSTSNNDFCVQVPGTSSNFGTPCIGYHFRIVEATGEVDTANNVLDDGSGNLSAAGVVKGNNGVKAGASGSTIADTRAIANQVTFCTGGTAACTQATLQSAKIVAGFVTLSGGTATVTGMASFTAASTYWCSFSDATSAANPMPKFAPVSGSSFTITGTGTDSVVYTCVGY